MTDADPIAQRVIEAMSARDLRMATAESTVGGLIGHLLTDVPGSSRVFAGGITAYANDAKTRLLGVGAATLEEHGSVSEATVLEMAHGAREAFGVDLAVAESGIAGPTASPRYPAGRYYIGLVADGHERAGRYDFPGTREETKQQAAEAALAVVLEYLEAIES